MTNLIVFDIDNTLTKSDDQHIIAYTSSMKAIGIHEINQNWKEYEHHTDSYILKVNYENNLTKRFDLDLIKDFEKNMVEIMQTLAPVQEIEGAKRFVEYLKNEKNYALSFATGSLLQPAILKLEQANVWHDQELIAASNQFYDRESIVSSAIEKARKYYNVTEFDNIISIGDGIWDMKTARNLNLEFIGVGLENYDDFQKENIDVHTENWVKFDFESAENNLLKLKVKSMGVALN